ncbi:hypothetical protein QVD17_41600 [Tagetes erecta]|uniref:Uncharacterized protein n=1 Tax=Tagetes erecta TaxID=13708 RepID=A0AAD8NEY0_TARER|nr:hypothetical protein QVD17_41600 [Tagetes erecta]
MWRLMRMREDPSVDIWISTLMGLISAMNPEEIPWGAAGADFMVEPTRVFTDKDCITPLAKVASLCLSEQAKLVHVFLGQARTVCTVKYISMSINALILVVIFDSFCMIEDEDICRNGVLSNCLESG